MALSPEYQRIMDLMRAKGTRDLERTREERLSPLYERVGLRSPQIGRAEEESVQDLISRLSDTEVDLMLRQVQRSEGLEDASRAETQQRGMFGLQSSTRARELGSQQEFAREQSETAFSRQIQLRDEQREYEADERKRAEKEQKKSMLTSLLMSVGLGAATGGIGLLPGIGAGVKGAAIGGLMGGPAAGQAAAFGLFGQQQQQPQQIPLQFGSPSGNFMTPGSQMTSLYPEWMQPGRRY